jgi:NAD-dependent dihydropyrimidine dehydrogenase PreA subunit
MKRKIIKIDQDKCTGCGLCIPNCPEGAIQVIDNKARLVSDLLCDGLGACLGHCPEGAITVEEREAVPYDEAKVMESIVKQGANTIKAHLEHLKSHGQDEYYQQALDYLTKNNVPLPKENTMTTAHAHAGGCPGSRSVAFDESKTKTAAPAAGGPQPSQLTHWPVQMHLISPAAPHFQKADLLLAADCVAYVLGGFHQDYLKGRKLAIACPKLDDGLDVYKEKLVALIDDAKINTLTVMIMQVPCCGGLLQLAQQAVAEAKRKVPIKALVVSLKGEILSEEWM